MPVEVRVERPKDFDRLLNGLDALQRGEAVGRGAARFAPLFIRALVEKSQALAGSGPFARRWVVKGNAAAIMTRNTYDKAAYVEFDTRPHIIRPRRAKALAWRGRGAGRGRGAFSAFKVKASTKAAQYVFAMKVRHPGTTGKHIFPKVLAEKTADLFRIIGEEVKKILGGK